MDRPAAAAVETLSFAACSAAALRLLLRGQGRASAGLAELERAAVAVDMPPARPALRVVDACIFCE